MARAESNQRLPLMGKVKNRAQLLSFPNQQFYISPRLLDKKVISMAVTHLTSENFDKETGKGKVIVDFWASWCGPCQMMGPVFERLSGEMPAVKFCKLETDQQPDAAQRFNIRGIPSLIMFVDGKKVGEHVGFATKDMLKNKITDVFKL
ncbi:MAG: thioredoxin [Nanoarchaeota archaeon]